MQEQEQAFQAGTTAKPIQTIDLRLVPQPLGFHRHNRAEVITTRADTLHNDKKTCRVLLLLSVLTCARVVVLMRPQLSFFMPSNALYSLGLLAASLCKACMATPASMAHITHYQETLFAILKQQNLQFGIQSQM